jgi:HAMP domain-containing protein
MHRASAAVDGLLAVPLSAKIVAANGMAVVVAAFVGARVHPLPAGWIVGLVVLVAAVNAVLVRLALRPLRALEGAARAVEEGRLDVRVPPSRVADREMRRVVGIFNAVLDSVDWSRRRDREAASRLLARAEEDRSDSARGLLDQVAQVLSALQLRLALLERTLSGEIPAAELARLRSGVQSALDQVHGIAVSLSPPELDHLGLSGALRAEARRLSSRLGVGVHVTGGFGGAEPPAGRARATCRLATRVVEWAAERSTEGDVTVRMGHDSTGLLVDVSAAPGAGRGVEPDPFLLDLMDHARLLGGWIRPGVPGGPHLRLSLWIPVPGSSPTPPPA